MDTNKKYLFGKEEIVQLGARNFPPRKPGAEEVLRFRKKYFKKVRMRGLVIFNSN
jgi:hypothetical protein